MVNSFALEATSSASVLCQDLGPVSSVSAGYDHTCAVTADGRLVCFGESRSGQCDVPEPLKI
ncbi:unnamed protein product [Symbiodinium sp. KB8]|nr:unnamed protein product [Symbiodinium sp. KB8]